jgi:hypothetical protein
VRRKAEPGIQAELRKQPRSPLNSTLAVMSDFSPSSESETKLLSSMRELAHEELLFFSNKGKEAREQWVVSQFLQRLDLPFLEAELNSPPQHSKIDVKFRDGSFQVKEILNPGSTRSDETRETYERLKIATRLEQVVGPSFIYDVPSPTTIYSLVLGEASRLAIDPKYEGTKHELDLLFYVTRTRASPILTDEIVREHLASLGWRSISCLAGKQATILYAQTHAPSFLLHHLDG